MKIMVIICRVLLGAAFIVFGLNIIHPFMPMPPMPEDSLPARFGAVMAPSHWMALIGVFQLVGGLLVILGRTTPMGLVFLGPVLVNIVAFHVFLDNGKGLVPGLVFCALELFLIYAYRSYFLPIFTLNAQYGKGKN